MSFLVPVCQSLLRSKPTPKKKQRAQPLHHGKCFACFCKRIVFMSSLHQTQGWLCAPIRATGKIHCVLFLLSSSSFSFLFFFFLLNYSFLVSFFSFLLLTSYFFLLFPFLFSSSFFLLSSFLLNLCALSVFVSETSFLGGNHSPLPLERGWG